MILALVTADGALGVGYPARTRVEPAGILPSMQIWGTKAKNNAAWFANFELYIYRNEAWL